jgi:hypothetical protein
VFVKLIRVSYRFEETQKLVIRLFDVDDAAKTQSTRLDLSKQDFIGEIHTSMAQVMGSRGSSYTGSIQNPSHPSRAKGTITVRGEEVKNSNALVVLQFVGEALDKKVRWGGGGGGGGGSSGFERLCGSRTRLDRRTRS